MKFFVLFLMIVACVVTGNAAKNDVCGLPHSRNGDGRMACQAYIPAWSYNSAANECVNFIYGGCGGNDNRFLSKETCEKTCL